MSTQCRLWWIQWSYAHISLWLGDLKQIRLKQHPDVNIHQALLCYTYTKVYPRAKKANGDSQAGSGDGLTDGALRGIAHRRFWWDPFDSFFERLNNIKSECFSHLHISCNKCVSYIRSDCECGCMVGRSVACFWRISYI